MNMFLLYFLLVGKSLGQGTFGKVRIGTHTITNEQVAIKILEKDKIKDKSDVERVTREINILKKVRHPNVIQLYEVRNPHQKEIISTVTICNILSFFLLIPQTFLSLPRSTDHTIKLSTLFKGSFL